MTQITVKINQDAYDAIDNLGFEILDVLQTFGEEVWENNNELSENFDCQDVATAFIQYILDQSHIAERFDPVYI
jgi:hypothetical protein